MHSLNIPNGIQNFWTRGYINSLSLSIEINIQVIEVGIGDDHANGSWA